MKTTTPYKPWEIMSYAKDLLGIGYMQRILGIKSQTQVYRYCRNPEMITEDPPATGFIERTRQLGVDLQQAGADDAARAIAEYIAEALGYEIVKKGGYHETSMSTMRQQAQGQADTSMQHLS